MVIAACKTFLRPRRLLRFQARVTSCFLSCTKPHLCLLVPKLPQQGPSTSQPRRLLLRPAQQYLSPQMYQPRRHTDALAAYHPGVVNNLKSQTTTLFITGVRCIPPAHSIPPYQSDSIYSGDFTLVQLSNWYTTVYHPGW